MSATILGFECRPLSVRWKETSCAKRHAEGVDPVCRRCPVGASHKRGETPATWPDGAPIVRLGIVSKRYTHARIRRRGMTGHHR